MSTPESNLRVSVAALNRVLIEDPQGARLLALECKASLVDGKPRVWAQPFGGAVRIFDPQALEQAAGTLRYDSERSRTEQDARFLIEPGRWEAIKTFCIQHLSDSSSTILEASPHRELAEELYDALKITLHPNQYTCEPAGFVIENTPVGTDNVHTRGTPTVRIYRIFEVYIRDLSLAAAMIENSARWTESLLQAQALADAGTGGKGRANAVLVSPHDQVVEAYQKVQPHRRYAPLTLHGHVLDPSVAAVLPVDVPQYERIR